MRRLLLAFAFIFSGCLDFGFEPVYRITDLRVLAVRAEPPELRPGETAVLDALVVDPSGAQVNTFWVACDPDPTKLGGSACVQEGEFRQDVESGGIPTEAEGARVLGLGPSVPYGAPAETFAALGPEDLTRRRGLAAAVVLVAFTGAFANVDEAIEKVRKNETPNVIVLKRIKVVETDAPNRNPEIAEVRAGGAPLAAGATLGIAPRAKAVLLAEPAAAAAEAYTFIGPEGETEERTERLTVSWFTTAGEMGAVSDGSYRVLAGEEMEWIAPEEPGPAKLWTVVRDGRGGVAWAERSAEVR
jgi:hypothetical protein